MNITCIRRNKTYKNRKLVFKDSKNKTIHEVTPWIGWICHSKRIEGELHRIIRKHTFENLYWLLGQDCDKEDWEKFIWRKHQGILYGVCTNGKPESVFFNEEEYKMALNSFNNK
jgi:hypothetical protein